MGILYSHSIGLLHSFTLLTRLIINLSDIFSVALLIIMSNTMGILYSHSIGLLHSFTLLTRLIPAFVLIYSFAGLWNTRIASEGVRQHKNGRDKLIHLQMVEDAVRNYHPHIQ